MRIAQLPPSRSVPAHRFYAQARSRRRISMYVCLPAPLLGLSGARENTAARVTTVIKVTFETKTSSIKHTGTGASA